MPTDHAPNSAVQVISLVPLAAFLVMAVGDMVLIGWAFDIAALKSILPVWVSMKANAAACFVLIGFALLLTTHSPATFNPQFSIFLSRLARFCGLLAGMIGLLTLGEYIFGWNLGIDHWLFSEPAGAVFTSHPGRMAPETALNFVLLSVALWVTGGSRQTRTIIRARGAILVSVSLGLLVTTLALAALLSYFTPWLGSFGWFGITLMAVHTATLFAILGISIIAVSWQPEVLSWSLSRYATVAFACGMALLVFIGLNTSRSQFWMKETSAQIAKAEEMQGDINSILTEIVDAHVHARNYAVTGGERFLKSYLSAKADCNTKLETLHRLEFVAAEPAHQKHFALVEAQAKAQFQWLQQIIDASRTGMTDAARNSMIAHGEDLLDSLRSIFDQIGIEHHQLIKQLKLEAESVSRFVYLSIFAGTLASLLIFLTVIFRLNFAMSDRKLAEAKIQRMNQLYNLLSQCNQAVVRSANKEELFQHTCRDAVNIGGFKMAWIGMVDEVSKQVKPVASYGDGVEYLEGVRISVDADSPFGRGPTGTSIREKQPFWCQDFMNSRLTASWHESGARFGWSASAALPLYRNGVAIGALMLYSGAVNAFDDDVRHTLVEMAMDISHALDYFAVEAERKQAVEALRKSNERFDLAVKGANDGIWDWDIEANTNYFSPRFLELLDYGPSELAHELATFEFLLHPEDRAWVFDRVSQHLENKVPYNVEYRMRTKNGEYRWFQARGEAIRDQTGKPCRMAGSITDITGRKMAEEALSESESRFRGLVETTSDWLWEVDENTVYTYASPKIRDILGYEVAEIIGKTPFDFMPPEEAKRVADIFGRIHAARKPFKNLENTNLHKDGRPVVLETNGVPVIDTKGKFCGYRGIDRDITERKQAEFKLAEQLNELRRWRDATLGREMRVIELKHEVNELLGQAGQLPRYPSAEQSNTE